VGKSPTPTVLKVLTGAAAHNPQRVNKAEPKPGLGATPPPFLPRRGPAWSAWKRHTSVLLRIRVLTEADADALALGCLALAEYLEARAEEASWRRADAAWKRYNATLIQFGMTPSARTRISAIPIEESDSLQAWAAK
jgi:phage terminase small subunit